MGDDVAPRSVAKGKGKDVESITQESPPEGSTAQSSTTRTSLAANIAQSAAALPSFLLSGPPAGGLGDNEKAESSRTGELLARAGESSVQLRSNTLGGEAIKPAHTEEHVAREEASFAAFLDSEVPAMSSGSGELERAWQSASAVTSIPNPTPAAETLSHSVAEQQAKDGADVVALLSGGGDFDYVPDADEHISRDDLASLRKALFPEESAPGATPSTWDNVLNFIPEYFRGHTAAEDDLSTHLGTTDADEAWQQWIEQWSRVLTSYQDEVWGDLGALVEEARAEVRQLEEVKPGEKPPEPTALLRLRAIVGHLRGAH
ncbi:hypothetical protein N656DRAFT_764351 [Canariomyces notabilis]|uniref:Uncharacterized protein n=1 Tax=Canariomyces notabilis TaxID=2074819 RepID=A0AAN6TM55_9PEZI|nr:hypothetical protein N656DRAFT_764351 [Canariomyces arenarius]